MLEVGRMAERDFGAGIFDLHGYESLYITILQASSFSGAFKRGLVAVASWFLPN